MKTPNFIQQQRRKKREILPWNFLEKLRTLFRIAHCNLLYLSLIDEKILRFNEYIDFLQLVIVLLGSYYLNKNCDFNETV